MYCTVDLGQAVWLSGASKTGKIYTAVVKTPLAAMLQAKSVLCQLHVCATCKG